MIKNGNIIDSQIQGLVEMWKSWMKLNTDSKDKTLSVQQRSIAAKECEILIQKRYQLIDKIDGVFDEFIKR